MLRAYESREVGSFQDALIWRSRFQAQSLSLESLSARLSMLGAVTL